MRERPDASGGFNEVKALIEGQGRAWEEFKKTNDARLVALEKGQSTAELDAKLDKLGGELDKLSEGMQRIDDIEKRMNRPDFGSEKDRNYDALDGSHALVLLTEWRSYRAPNFAERSRRASR